MQSRQVDVSELPGKKTDIEIPVPLLVHSGHFDHVKQLESWLKSYKGGLLEADSAAQTRSSTNSTSTNMARI
jgi:hypothetical protein